MFSKEKIFILTILAFGFGIMDSSAEIVSQEKRGGVGGFIADCSLQYADEGEEGGVVHGNTARKKNTLQTGEEKVGGGETAGEGVPEGVSSTDGVKEDGEQNGK